jgi:hypothetical protein
MRKCRFFKPFGILFIVAIFGATVMLLWNWLMPSIFGLDAINFWQAAGLLILSRILFGGFGGGGGHRHANHIHEKWMKMSPEQRRDFINKRRRFGFGHHSGCEHFHGEAHREQNKADE